MTYSATNQDKVKPKIAHPVVFTLVLLVFVVISIFTPAIELLERNLGLSSLFRVRGEIVPPDDIVIVTLNSAAAERMGFSRHSYTWPRTVYAELLNKLQSVNVNLIIWDIAFKEARGEEEDQALELALAKRQNNILYKYLKRHQIPTLNGAIDIEEEIPPPEPFSQHALASGFFVLPKTTGNIFHAPLQQVLPKGVEPAQPLLALLAAQPVAVQNSLWLALTDEALDPNSSLEKQAKTLMALASNAKASEIPKQALPLFQYFASSEPLMINFYGAAQTINHIDIDRVLTMDQQVLAQWFNHKYVYIGYLESWQTEQQDAYSTVFTSTRGVDISGVEISATVLANLIHQQNIRPFSKTLMVLLFVVFYVGTIYSYRLAIGYIAFAQIAAIVGYSTMGYLMFCRYYLWLPLVSPLIAMLLGNAVQLQYYYRSNRKRLHHIRFALSQYLPQHAANDLSHNINALEKQHQLVSGVVLFTDIKGYTSLSEQLDPATLHSLMNQYYDCLIKTVKQYHGFVGNIVGDSLMALWTGPAITTEMCQQALACARSIQMNIKNNKELAEQLPTCIALHGGQFSLGNLGAKGHFEYSPVGDIINTCSRIEHFNRDLGTQLLLSNIIKTQLANADTEMAELRYLGDFNLRNKTAAVPLFTDALSSVELQQRFMRAVELFQQHQFTKALNLFNQIFDQQQDGPSQFYIRACQQQLEFNSAKP